mgnify:CR=1 FL=1
MKVLYSTQGSAEFDGKCYYHNGAQTNYKRYLPLGEDMTILLTQKNVDKPTMAKIDEKVHLIFLHKINTLKSYLTKTRENRRIAEAAVKEADVCVIHAPGEYDVIKYARKYNKPYLVVVCGCPWDSLWNYDWRGKLMAPLAYIKLRRTLKEAPYVVYVTSKFLQRRYPTKGKWIACSNANAVTGQKGVLERRLDHIEKLKKEKPVFKIGTSAAVDVPYKGQEYVIRAIGKLKKEGIEFEYHLIGRGDEARLRQIAKEEDVEESVVFHGSLPHNEVFAFLDDMDIYIQPSKQEGLPRAMIEAMSRGCLCMGSDIAGIPELIDAEYLFNKGDVKQIASILKQITSEKLEEQAKKNYESAKDYDVNVLSERRLNFLMDFKKTYNL